MGISILSECMLLTLARDDLDGTLKDWITLWIAHPDEIRQKVDLIYLRFISVARMRWKRLDYLLIL